MMTKNEVAFIRGMAIQGLGFPNIRVDLIFENFCWSTVDLQCCISFCWTAKWINYVYTYSQLFFQFFSYTGHYRVLSRRPVLSSRFLLVYYFVYSIVYL